MNAVTPVPAPVPVPVPDTASDAPVPVTDAPDATMPEGGKVLAIVDGASIVAGKDVSVKTTSKQSLLALYLSELIELFGVVIFALQQAAPQLIVLFPNQKWLGPLVMVIGKIWNVALRRNDQNKLRLVNHTQTLPATLPVGDTPKS